MMPKKKDSTKGEFRCAVCGRALTHPGVYVPGIGSVGPECRRKFAGMEAYLEAVHPKLTNALYGGASFRREELSQEDLYAFQEALRALKRSGLRVEVFYPHPDEVIIRVDGIERPETFRKMFRKDSWSEWAEKVELRALEREMQKELEEARARVVAEVRAARAAHAGGEA